MVTAEVLRHNRQLGITALECGVQTTCEHVHELTKRDSSRLQIIERMQLAKEFGFKVMAHVMPDLPGSNPQLDKDVIDDLLHGGLHVRVRDVRGAVAMALPAVGAVASDIGQANRMVLLSATLACLLLAAIVELWFSHQYHFLFDFDRFKLYPTMVL